MSKTTSQRLLLSVGQTDSRLLIHEHFIIIVRSALDEKGFCAKVNWANLLALNLQWARFLSSGWG